MPPPRSARARPMPPDERRLLIVSAALPLVSRHGFGVTTRQLAAAAEVAEGTLFRVFPDKDAIVEAALARALSPELVLEQLAGIDLSLPLLDRCTQVVEVLRARVRGIVDIVAALHRRPDPTGKLGVPHPGRPGSAGHRHEQDAVVLAAVARLLEPDRDRLLLPPEEVATVLRGLVVATTFPGFGGSPLTATQLVGVLLDGVRRPSTGRS